MAMMLSFYVSFVILKLYTLILESEEEDKETQRGFTSYHHMKDYQQPKSWI